MTRVHWRLIETLSGAGTITDSETKQTLAVDYYAEGQQEVLSPIPGSHVFREKKYKGRVKPVPPWPLSGHMLILQLEDGRRLKFWMDNHKGDISGSGEPADEPQAA